MIPSHASAFCNNTQMDNYLQLRAKALYDAAFEGDVASLLNLLHEDPFILDRYNTENSGCFTQSPLHIAANIGHLEFTREILSRKPELTEELDHVKRWSPLHMASGKGHLEIVKVLLSVNPNMCLATDVDGMNPVHVAAIKGQVHVLDELLKVVPQATRGRTNAGASVLHLCVQHCQIDALKFLINTMDDCELLNLKDAEGSTVLHLAVANKQPEMVKFLLEDKDMEKNVINTNGLTAMDIQIRNKKGKGSQDSEIWSLLKRAKVLRAKEALKPRNKHQAWVQNQENALMVVASLIATMAFQVGISPPGGSWQDDNGHVAGNSIMADVDKATYDKLIVCNTIGLVSSMTVILLLISGLPCKKLYVGILMITLWVSVTATTLTYIVSVVYLTGGKQSLLLSRTNLTVLYVCQSSVYLWLMLMVLLFLGHVVRILIKLIKWLMHIGGKVMSMAMGRTST